MSHYKILSIPELRGQDNYFRPDLGANDSSYEQQYTRFHLLDLIIFI